METPQTSQALDSPNDLCAPVLVFTMVVDALSR
jgi:hypothetical protein